MAPWALDQILQPLCQGPCAPWLPLLKVRTLRPDGSSEDTLSLCRVCCRFRATILTSVQACFVTASLLLMDICWSLRLLFQVTYYREACCRGGVTRKLWLPLAAFREENMLGELVSSESPPPPFHASQQAAGGRCVTLVLKSQDTDRNLGPNKVCDFTWTLEERINHGTGLG